MGNGNSIPIPNDSLRRVFSVWTLEQLHLAHRRYKDITMRFSINYQQFTDILSIDPVADESKAHFQLFTTKRTPKMVDALEVLSGICMFTLATLEEKLAFIYQMYDFDGTGTINADEVTILMRSTSRALAKIGKTAIPTVADVEKLVEEALSYADLDADGHITLNEYTHWAMEKKLLLDFMGEISGDARVKLYVALEKDHKVIGCIEFVTQEEMETATLEIVRDKLTRTVLDVPDEYTFVRQHKFIKKEAEERVKAWDCLPFMLLGTPGLHHEKKKEQRGEGNLNLAQTHLQREQLAKAKKGQGALVSSFHFQYRGERLQPVTKKITKVRPIYKHYKTRSIEGHTKVQRLCEWRIGSNWSGDWIKGQEVMHYKKRTDLRKVLNSKFRKMGRAALDPTLLVKDHTGHIVRTFGSMEEKEQMAHSIHYAEEAFRREQRAALKKGMYKDKASRLQAMQITMFIDEQQGEEELALEKRRQARKASVEADLGTGFVASTSAPGMNLASGGGNNPQGGEELSGPHTPPRPPTEGRGAGQRPRPGMRTSTSASSLENNLEQENNEPEPEEAAAGELQAAAALSMVARERAEANENDVVAGVPPGSTAMRPMSPGSKSTLSRYLDEQMAFGLIESAREDAEIREAVLKRTFGYFHDARLPAYNPDRVGGGADNGGFLYVSAVQLEPDEVEAVPVVLLRPTGDMDLVDEKFLVHKEYNTKLDLAELCRTGNLDAVVAAVLMQENNLGGGDALALNQQDVLGRTCLHAAAQGGHSDVIKFLLEHRLEGGRVDWRGQNALHVAASKGNLRAVRVLLEAGVAADVQDVLGKTPLHLALEEKQRKRHEVAKKEKKEKEKKEEEKASGIENAEAEEKKAQRQQEKDAVMKRLREVEERQALLGGVAGSAKHHFSQKLNKIDETVELLWGHCVALGGAVLELKDNDGNTPNTLEVSIHGGLLQAAREGNLERVQHLVHSGKTKDLNVGLNELGGRTALHEACQLGHLSVVDFLISCGAETANLDWRKQTPLHYAASAGQKAVVHGLLAGYTGAEAVGVSMRDVQGRTPLLCALYRRRLPCADVILTVGCKSREVALGFVNLQDNEGFSALHVCCASSSDGAKRTAELLLAAGARVDTDRFIFRAPKWNRNWHTDAQRQTLNELGTSMPLAQVATSKYIVDASGGVRSRRHLLGVARKREPLLDWLAEPANNPEGQSQLWTIRTASVVSAAVRTAALCCGTSVGVQMLEMLGMLLAAGVDPNAPDEDLNAPLLIAHHAVRAHLAAQGGEWGAQQSEGSAQYQQLVKLLCGGKGADLEVRSKANGRTMLILECAAELAWSEYQKARTQVVDGEARKQAGKKHAGHKLGWARGGACGGVDLVVVGTLLEKGAEIEARDAKGYTALTFAAGSGNISLLELLLKKGANPNSNPNPVDGIIAPLGDIDPVVASMVVPPLHMACAYAQVECTARLLEAGADADALSSATVVDTSAHPDGQGRVAERIAQACAVGAGAGDDSSSAASVVGAGGGGVAGALVAVGDGDVDPPSLGALHWAAGQGSHGCVEALLQHGADASLFGIPPSPAEGEESPGAYDEEEDSEGLLATEMASFRAKKAELGRPVLTALHCLLLAAPPAPAWDSPVWTAESTAESAVVGAEADAAAAARSPYGTEAEDSGSSSAVSYERLALLLVDKGADACPLCPDRRTALLMAAKLRYWRLVAKLVQGGVETWVREPSGATALHYAAADGRKEVVTQLLEETPNPEELCNMRAGLAGGQQLLGPLYLAALHAHVEVVALLIVHGAKLQRSVPCTIRKLVVGKRARRKEITQLQMMSPWPLGARCLGSESFLDRDRAVPPVAPDHYLAVNGQETALRGQAGIFEKDVRAAQRGGDIMVRWGWPDPQREWSKEFPQKRGWANGSSLWCTGGASGLGPHARRRRATAALLAHWQQAVNSSSSLSLLQHEARLGNKGLASLLMEAGARLDVVDEAGLSPLAAAAVNGHAGVVEALLQELVKRDSPTLANPMDDEDGFLVLPIVAAAVADSTECTRLLAAHLHEWCKDAPLDRACWVRSMRVALEHEVTAVEAAARHGNLANVKELLDLGATPTPAALRAALIGRPAGSGASRMRNGYLEKKPKAETKGRYRGVTESAVGEEDADREAIILELLAKGVQPAGADTSGSTGVLELACRYGYWKAAAAILQKGVRSEANTGALHLAAKSGMLDLVKIMVEGTGEEGASTWDVDLLWKDDASYTLASAFAASTSAGGGSDASASRKEAVSAGALYYAIRAAQLRVVLYLLVHGATEASLAPVLARDVAHCKRATWRRPKKALGNRPAGRNPESGLECIGTWHMGRVDTWESESSPLEQAAKQTEDLNSRRFPPYQCGELNHNFSAHRGWREQARGHPYSGWAGWANMCSLITSASPRCHSRRLSQSLVEHLLLAGSGKAGRAAGRSLIHEESALGNLGTVELLLDSGASPDQYDAEGDGALADASRRGHAAIVRALLAGNANTLPMSGSAKAKAKVPLVEACRAGMGRIVELLLSAWADADADVGAELIKLRERTLSDAVTATLLGKSAPVFTANKEAGVRTQQPGFARIVMRLLSAGAEVPKGALLQTLSMRGRGLSRQARHTFGAVCKQTDLIAADHEGLVQRMLEQRADVNEHSVQDDKSSLMYACERGMWQAVGVMLEDKRIMVTGSAPGSKRSRRSADVLRERGEYRREPLHYAIMAQQEALLKRMLVLGVDVAEGDYRKRSALHYVAVLGNVRLAGALLMHVAALETCDELLHMRDDRGHAPLHLAAAHGHMVLVEALLKIGATLTQPCEKGLAPAAHAVLCGHDEVAHFLVEEAGYDVSAEAHNGDSLVLTAARGSQVSAALWLLELGTEAARRSRVVGADGLTMLHFAAITGSLRFCRFLVDSGRLEDRAQVSAQDEHGYTPLHYSRALGHCKVSRLLLERGGNPDIETLPPLRVLATGTGRVRDASEVDLDDMDEDVDRGFVCDHFGVPGWMRDVLLSASAAGRQRAPREGLPLLVNPSALDPETAHMWSTEDQLEMRRWDTARMPPLHFACSCGNVRMVEILLQSGGRGRPFGSGARLEVEQVDGGGWTPLLHAVHVGLVELVQLLVERGGADVNHVCKAEDSRYRGHTPVMHAAMRKHEAVALYLLQAGAAATGYGMDQGLTLLHAAAAHDMPRLADYLLTRGYLPVAGALGKRYAGHSPMDYALGFGHLRVALVMQKHAWQHQLTLLAPEDGASKGKDCLGILKGGGCSNMLHQLLLNVGRVDNGAAAQMKDEQAAEEAVGAAGQKAHPTEATKQEREEFRGPIEQYSPAPPSRLDDDNVAAIAEMLSQRKIDSMFMAENGLNSSSSLSGTKPAVPEYAEM